MRARRFCCWGLAAVTTARRWSGGECECWLGMGLRLLRRPPGVDSPGGENACITTSGRGDRGDLLVTLKPAARFLAPPLYSHSVSAHPLPAHQLRAGKHTAHADALSVSRVVHLSPVIRSNHTRRCIFLLCSVCCLAGGAARYKEAFIYCGMTAAEREANG